MSAVDRGDRPLRLLMTGSEWFGTRAGGLNRYFESLYVALSKRPDVDVSAAAFGDAPPGGSEWEGLGRDLTRRTLASRKGRLKGVDVLDRHFAPYGPGRRNLDPNSALVLHFQGPWFAESLAVGQSELRTKVKKWWETRRYAEGDRAVVLCAEFGSILEREFGVPADRVRVIAPGVDLERFSVGPTPMGGRPLVLCVRRLERRMGIDVLLEAWPEVLARVPDARLGIVGTGREGQALLDQASALGVSGSVRQYGAVSDDGLTALYAEATLTVVPTRELEGFGLIALESLATGTPVVVTRVGGLPDSVEGLDAGLVVPPLDPRALAERIVDALDGGVPTASACRRHAEGFAWDRVAARHVDLYREVLR